MCTIETLYEQAVEVEEEEKFLFVIHVHNDEFLVSIDVLDWEHEDKVGGIRKITMRKAFAYINSFRGV